MSKKTGIILTVICTLLVILQIVSITRLNRLKKDYNYLISDIGYIKDRVNMINGEVSGQVNRILNEIKEQNRYVKNITWKGLEMEGENVNVKCDITLNNLTEGDVPYLLTKEKAEDNWAKIKFVQQNGLNYSISTTLNPEKVYDYQLFIDGKVKKNTDIKPIPVYEYKYPDFNVEIGDYNPDEDNSKKRIVVSLYVKGKAVFEPMRLKNAKVLLYSDGVKIDTLDMMSKREFEESLKNRNKTETVERSKELANAGVLFAEIDFSKYSKKIDEIKVLATYNNGHQVTKTAYKQ